MVTRLTGFAAILGAGRGAGENKIPILRPLLGKEAVR